MKQKLAVARTVLHRPPLVFLDEPTAGLDPVSAAALRDDLAHLSHKEGVTIFLTTHNLTEAERLCDEVGVIRSGKLLAVGTPDDLRARGGERVDVTAPSSVTDEVLAQASGMPGVRSATRSTDGATIELEADASFAPVLAFLVANGVAVEEARRDRPSLEEAFLALVKDDGERGGR